MKRFSLIYFLFCFFFFTFFSSGFIDSQDGLQYLTIARRMYYDNTFEMPQESFDTGDNIYMNTQTGNDGKIYPITGFGYSLALIPSVIVEDIFLKISGLQPITAFPLENDWPVLLFASMTNAFFGALLALYLYKYLKSFQIAEKDARIMSFFSVIATNLWIYTKHSFAHMMFTSFLVCSFYYMRLAIKTNSYLKVALSGICLGIVTITYNQTYLFALPAIFLYFLLLNFEVKFSNYSNLIQKILKKGVIFLLALTPFLVFNFKFNSMRMPVSETAVLASAVESFIFKLPPAYIIVEGIWGLLFSPGKSIFLFSPPLIVLVLFWFKLIRKIKAETITFLYLFLIYLWFMGTFMGAVDFPVWHGDASWGPRYMIPTVPFLMILVSVIWTRLSKLQKLFVVPLFICGIYVNLLGILLPYQIRFAGLQNDVEINGRRFNVSEYGNQIPRYSPVFKLSKTLFKRLKTAPATFDHGKYSIILKDGFDYPFDVGWTAWRGMRPQSVILFKNEENKIAKLSLQIKNHQIDPESSASANLVFNLNGAEVQNDIIPVNTEKEIVVSISSDELKKNENILKIFSKFESSNIEKMNNKQVLFLQLLRVNEVPQNIISLDYPYVSPISQSLMDFSYDYWGNEEKDPWSIWHMHSGVYEQTFDLWWLRSFHYWDFPKTIHFILFIVNASSIIYFGYFVFNKFNDSN